MQIVDLIAKHYWQTKLDRTRFQTADAMGAIRTGPGWPGWQAQSVQANLTALGLKPDVLIVYKPDQYPGIDRLQCKTVVRYNEVKPKVYDKERPLVDYALFHHANDWQKYGRPHDFNIPLPADPLIFAPQEIEPQWDILLIGRLSDVVYPLRRTIEAAFRHLPDLRCGVYKHPGYDVSEAHTGQHLQAFAQAINSTKVAAFCSSIYRYRFGKYAEVAMCARAIAADFPDECPELWPHFVHQLDAADSPETTAGKLREALDEAQAYSQNGRILCQHQTPDWYARRFLEAMQERI